jgi:hypothetical protein
VTTVLFVHGTGVRQPAYSAVFDQVSVRLAEIRPGLAVSPCYWGGEHGARLNCGGASVPAGVSSRGIDADLGSAPDEDDIALWDVLERDPLFELRLLSEHAAEEPELPPNAIAPSAALASAARRLAAAETVAFSVRMAGLDEVFAISVTEVLDSGPAHDAFRREPGATADLRATLARAFVARSMKHADEELGSALPLDGATRDALIAAIVAELGGSDRGLGRVVVDLALRVGMRPVERRRAAISDAAAPVAGDVLMYLARGEPIREFIGAAVAALDGPVVIVAHSLGGIASFELLVTRELPQVEMLVTVGSQVPLLYELNALPTLELGADLPGSVPRWVNVFDRRDLLAYAASKIFLGRAEDRHIDNRTPFPRAHSAYFSNKRFYTLLDEVLP